MGVTQVLRSPPRTRANEREVLSRLVRSNLSCILIVSATGRIVAVIEIARAGGSMAVTQVGERRRARGAAAPTLEAAIRLIASRQNTSTVMRFIPVEHAGVAEVSRTAGPAGNPAGVR